MILSPAGPEAPAGGGGGGSDMDPPPPPSLGTRWSGVEGGLQQGQEQAPFPEIPGLHPLSRALHHRIFPGCSASPGLSGKDWKVPSVLSLLGLTGSPTPSSHFPGHHRKLISWSLLKDSVSELSLPPSRNPNSHPISSGSSPPLLHPPILETDPAAPRAVALR